MVLKSLLFCCTVVLFLPTIFLYMLLQHISDFMPAKQTETEIASLREKEKSQAKALSSVSFKSQYTCCPFPVCPVTGHKMSYLPSPCLTR